MTTIKKPYLMMITSFRLQESIMPQNTVTMILTWSMQSLYHSSLSQKFLVSMLMQLLQKI